MLDFSAKFRLEKMSSGNPALYLLREQFESFAGSPNRVDACDWIARCLYQLQQYGEAGSWYEAAGWLLFANQGLPPELKALSALEEYERALESYRQSGDAEAEAECLTVIERLKRACAPA